MSDYIYCKCGAKFERNRVKPGMSKFRCSKCKAVIAVPPQSNTKEPEEKTVGTRILFQGERMTDEDHHLLTHETLQDEDEDDKNEDEESQEDFDSLFDLSKGGSLEMADSAIVEAFDDSSQELDFSPKQARQQALMYSSEPDIEDSQEDILLDDSGIEDSGDDFERLDSDPLTPKRPSLKQLTSPRASSLEANLEASLNSNKLGIDDSGIDIPDYNYEERYGDSVVFDTEADNESEELLDSAVFPPSATAEKNESEDQSAAATLVHTEKEEEEEDDDNDEETEEYEATEDEDEEEGIQKKDQASALEAICKGIPLHSSHIPELTLQKQNLPSLHLSECRLHFLEITQSTIEGDVHLSSLQVIKGIHFKNVTIKGELLLTQGESQGAILFENCRISRIFQVSEFHAKASFSLKQCHFLEPILWTSSHFDQGVSLVQSHSLQGCSFRDCHFHQEVSWDHSLFKGILHLESSQFEGPLSFRKTVADALYLPPLTLKKALVSQHSKEKDYASDLEQYAFLWQHCRQRALAVEEDWAFRKYQQARRKTLSLKNPLNWIRRPLDWLFLDLFMGYATRPALSILHLFLVFFFYSTLYFTQLTPSTPESASSSSLPLRPFLSSELLNKIVNAFDYSFQSICFQFPSSHSLWFSWIHYSQALFTLLLLLLFTLTLFRRLIR